MLTFKKSFARNSRAVAALLILAIAGTTRAAEPEVLKQIPGDAYGVFVINNLRALSTKIANAGTRLELPLPPDPIGYLTRSIGIEEGFDPAGSAAIVMLAPAPDKAGQPYITPDGIPPAVLLLPTTNSKAMLEPFMPSEADKDGISTITMPNDPDQKGFVTTVANKWVAMALKKEDLAAYIARGQPFNAKVSEGTRKVFDANDIVFWANVEKLSVDALKALDEQKSEQEGMLILRGQVDKKDALASALERSILNLGFDIAREIFTGTNAGMITMRLTDSGATFGMSGDFKPESTLGKIVAAQGGRPPVSLAGLPGGNFIAASAMKINTEPFRAPLKNFLDGILAQPNVAKDPKYPEIKKAIDTLNEQLALVEGGSFVFLDPAGGGKNGVLNGAFLIDSPDPQKLLTSNIDSTKTILAQGMNPDIKQSVVVTQNAVTIKGVQLTKVNVKSELRAETPENPVSEESRFELEAEKRMFGPDGMTVYMGVVGKRMLIIYGSDNVTLESSVSAALANSNDIGNAPEVVGLKEQLVASPVAVAYLPIARWIGLAQAVGGPELGLPPAGAPVPAPGAPAAPPAKPVPPMVISLGVTGNTASAELHLPITTITAVQAAITEMQRAMQGGPVPLDVP